jgi:Cu/Ag efflux protein CusF
MLIVSSVAGIVFALGSVSTSLKGAQPPQPAPRRVALFGRVEAVDSERRVVTVKHGAIPGYMDSTTTEYSTEEGTVLNRWQPGDDIRATVHLNDLTLYHILIVYRRDRAKGRTSK